MAERKFTESAVKAFERYIKKADFYAVPVLCGSNRTEYKLFTGEGMKHLFMDERTRAFFREVRGSLRWQSKDRMRAPWRGYDEREIFPEVDRITFPGGKDYFTEIGGDLSRDQENKIASALTAIGFRGTKWTAVGHDKMEKRRYNPDIVGENGETIEVKGFTGELRISFVEYEFENVWEG